MNKEQLRNEMTNKLEQLTADQRKEIEQDLVNQLTQSSMWQNASVVGITLSHELEWDTHKAIEKAWDEGKIVVVPKCIHKTRQMDFYQINSFDQVKVGYVGILEPDTELTKKWQKNAIDLLIVPGRVFNTDGYRIGFGGGYYDRFLKDFQNETVSLVWKEQLVENLPVDHYDIAVNHLIVNNT